MIPAAHHTRHPKTETRNKREMQKPKSRKPEKTQNPGSSLWGAGAFIGGNQFTGQPTETSLRETKQETKPRITHRRGRRSDLASRRLELVVKAEEGTFGHSAVRHTCEFVLVEVLPTRIQVEFGVILIEFTVFTAGRAFLLTVFHGTPPFVRAPLRAIPLYPISWQKSRAAPVCLSP